MPSEPRLRRSARVFLFDEHGDVLLIRFESEVNGQPFVCWVTPGGEIEPHEKERDAAARELSEELGLRLTLTRPVHLDHGGEYVHLGERVRNWDVFFAAQCRREQPKLAGVTGDEIRLMREARWWTEAEIAATAELIFPRSIAQLIPQAWAMLHGEEPVQEIASGVCW